MSAQTNNIMPIGEVNVNELVKHGYLMPFNYTPPTVESMPPEQLPSPFPNHNPYEGIGYPEQPMEENY